MFIWWFRACLRHKKVENFIKKVSKREKSNNPPSPSFKEFLRQFSHISFDIFISMCPMTLIFFPGGNSKVWRVFLILRTCSLDSFTPVYDTKKSKTSSKRCRSEKSRIIPWDHLLGNFKTNFHISFDIFISMCLMTLIFFFWRKQQRCFLQKKLES